MRGLTVEERAILAEPESPDGPIATDEDVRLLELLKTQGRVADRVWSDGSLSASTVLALAASHIGHYADQIEHPQPGTRLDECRYYLELWVSIRTAVNRGVELGSEQVGELFDAVTSGDHDGLLSSDELMMVFSVEGRMTA